MCIDSKIQHGVATGRGSLFARVREQLFHAIRKDSPCPYPVCAGTENRGILSEGPSEVLKVEVFGNQLFLGTSQMDEIPSAVLLFCRRQYLDRAAEPVNDLRHSGVAMIRLMAVKR